MFTPGIVAGFIAIAGVLIAARVVGVLNLQQVHEAGTAETHTYAVKVNLEQLLLAAVDAETGQRGFIITDDPSYLEPYNRARGLIALNVMQVRWLTAGDVLHQLDLDRLSALVDLKLAELAEANQARRVSLAAAQAVVATNLGKHTMDQVRAIIARMEAREDSLLADRTAQTEQSYRTAMTSGFFLTGLSFLVLAALFIVVRRFGTERIRASQLAERLRVTLASIGDAVITTDAQGHLTGMNPMAESLTGWAQADAVGRPVAEVFVIVNAETREPVENPVESVLRERVVTGLANHTVLIARDGREVPVDDSAAPIRTEGGGVTGAVMVFRDVTARRQAEHERSELIQRERAARVQAEAAIQAAPAAMFIVDAQGTVVLVNELSEALLGYSRGELVGQSIDRLVPERLRSSHGEYRRGFYRELRRRAMGPGRDLYAQRKDGTEVPVEIGLSPMETPDGTFVVAAVTDITERKRAEEALRRSEAALKEADRRKDNFLATLSHELRNPLAAIRNASDLLERAANDPNRISWTRGVLQRQVAQMVRLIEDLLDISRITEGKIHLQKQRVELGSVVKTAVEATTPLMEAAKHAFTVSLPPHPVYLNGDPERLDQILSNLLENAAKYTAPGGTISLSADRQRSGVVISIRDTGFGIPPQHLVSIFGMFSQVEPVLERSQGGLGIGLALVKGLVELHDGTVEARSDGPGRGSEFRVYLPTVVAAEREPTPAVPIREVRVRRGHRVLVVDDQRDSADTLAAVLQLAGHEVKTAYDGPGALEAVASFRPSVAVLDIGLPGMTGYEVARRIRQTQGPGLLLIALSGWGQAEDRRRANEAGFDHHLTKPVDPAVLADVIARTGAARSPR